MTDGAREYAKLTFWGTRGSIPTPGRTTEKYGGNTPCVSLVHKDTTIIIDAGSGIRNFGLDVMDGGLGQDTKALLMHLFLSHTHWDHIQGLPFFQPAYIKGNNLAIYGSPNKERFLEAILRDQMDYDYFPIGMAALAAELRIVELSPDPLKLGEVTVDWQEQIYHPGGCVRYRFTVNGKKIVYASDVELDHIFFARKDEPESQKRSKEYLEFVAGAEILIADGQYTEEEYRTKVDWGHTSMPALMDIAYRAGVKQLAIFHHDPQHSDKFLNDLWAKYSPKYQTATPPMNVFWAREGLTMPI